MTAGGILRWMGGAAVALAAMAVMGCEDEVAGELTANPAIPAGVRVDRGEEQFIWKFQPVGYRCAGTRLITRWPSYLFYNYGLTGENSYVMAGNARLEFYKFDEDGTNGMKASYATCGTSAGDFTADQRVVLYKDGAPFAFAIVPNPAQPYVAPLP